MSSLYKLSIQGVRSFDTNGSETIQFGLPLTLICGQNGSGKTTIIECLKYATTGVLPPNAKGAAFILDPDVCGRSVVSAQVKLAYVNLKGESMIVTRTMKLMKKPGTRESNASRTFKTLDGNLTIIDKNHNKRSLSTKSAELDQQIPRSLGCSVAILENVLFCHQDESLWPLSEASVLKKRFDEIFEASKYTKVLDSLKAIKRDMTVDIKLIEQSVNHLKLDVERAGRINEKLTETSGNVETLLEDISVIKFQIDDKEKEADILFNTAQNYEQTLAEYDEINNTISTLTKQLERMQLSIEFLPEASDQELIQMRDKYDDNETLKNSVITIKEEIKSKSEELIDLEAKLNALIRLDGSLKARESDYEKNMKLLADLHNENSLDIAKDKLTKKCDSLETKYDTLQTSNKKLDSEKRATLQKVLDSIIREKQHEEIEKLELYSLTDKIALSKKQLGFYRTKVQDLDLLKTELETLEKQLSDRKSKNEIVKLENEIEDSKSSLVTKERDIEDLNRKILVSNKQSGVHSRIAYLEEQNQTKQRALDKFIEAEKDQVEKVLGVKLDIQQCRSQLQKIQESNNIKLETQSKVTNEKLNELQKTQSFKVAEEKEIANIKKQIESHRSKITAVLGDEDLLEYEQIIQDLQDDYNTTYENMNTADLSILFKVKAIEIAEKSHSCQLCLRPFDSDGLKKFVTSLKESLQDTNVKEKLLAQFNEAKKELEDAKAINSNVLQFRELCNQLKNAEKRQIDFQNEEETLRKSYAEATEALSLIKTDVLLAESVVEPLGNITRISNEISSNEAQIRELKEELNDYGTNNLSISELQSHQSLLNSEIKELRLSIDEKSETKYRIIREIGRIENKVKDTKLEVSELERKLSDIKNLETSIEEMQSKVTLSKKKLEELSESLGILEKKKAKETQELDEMNQTNTARERELASDLEKHKSDLKLFTGLYEEVQLYETKYKKQLEENRMQMEQLESSQQQCKTNYNEMNDKLRELENSVAQSSRIHHNIILNIEYRETEADIASNKSRLSSIDIESARLKKERYQVISKGIRDDISALYTDHAGKLGEVKILKDQIASLKHELETEYKDADKNFQEEWIKLHTNMFASNDIQTYSKALDNAIMKYHSLKMKDINRILLELWTQTYKGTDIDLIAIKTDVTLQQKGKRSYNYRVVMNKNSVELDMRGRCSAGQKVLASILIRLALAECFGTNCGMIALDEPTTNLDAENAEALAVALHRIIQIRQHQSNFQLIVITHDEKFLSHINGDQFTDDFYRVERNENQRSRIVRIPMSMIHGE